MWVTTEAMEWESVKKRKRGMDAQDGALWNIAFKRRNL